MICFVLVDLSSSLSLKSELSVADLHPVQAADRGGGVQVRAGERRPPRLPRPAHRRRAVPDAKRPHEHPAPAVTHHR